MLNDIMLNVVMLNVIMLNVIMLSVIMLNVVIRNIILRRAFISKCHCENVKDSNSAFPYLRSLSYGKTSNNVFICRRNE